MIVAKGRKRKARTKLCPGAYPPTKTSRQGLGSSNHSHPECVHAQARVSRASAWESSGCGANGNITLGRPFPYLGQRSLQNGGRHSQSPLVVSEKA
jgi:hypothetical protein